MENNLEKIISILLEWKEMCKGFNSLTLTNEGEITLSNNGDWTFVKINELIWLNDRIKSLNTNWEVGSIFPPGLSDPEESLTIFLGFVQKPEDEDFCLDWDKNLSQSWEI